MPRLNPGQAAYVLERMVADRRISARDVSRYVSEMQREISELENRLMSLRQASSSSSTASSRGRGSRAAAKAGATPRRRSRVSAEQAASRKIQGRYLGLIRQIPASRRAHFQKVAKDRGREAAIKELVSALGK
ncbi:MAG TPA: hypothetical protein VFT12_03845 [Thermoanaerobaculia bacterium]|nr:hypothetical protein [Thermoanaerobaculia bacterium]